MTQTKHYTYIDDKRLIHYTFCHYGTPIIYPHFNCKYVISVILIGFYFILNANSSLIFELLFEKFSFPRHEHIYI